MGAHLDRMRVQEKENDQVPGSIRKNFAKSRRSKQSVDAPLDCGRSDSQRGLLADSRLPRQPCGNAQSQVYPQDSAPLLCKRDRLSLSARQHDERKRVLDERRRLSDVGAWMAIYGESNEIPTDMYKSFDRHSSSTRHPEMGCLVLNSSFPEVSRDSTSVELQKQDISFLESPSVLDSTALQMHETGLSKAVVDSTGTEISQKHDSAREQGCRKSFASKTSESKMSSKSAWQDRDAIGNDSFGKSDDNKNSKKSLKSVKQSLPSHSTNDARSPAGAMRHWLKHILKRKGLRTSKIGEQEKHSCQAFDSHHLKQKHCLDQKLWGQEQPTSKRAKEFHVVNSLPKDLLELRIPDDRIPNSSGVHLLGDSAIRTSTANRAHSSDHNSMPQFCRSSSVPSIEYCYMYQNIYVDMPQRSEVSAANLGKLPIIEIGDLQACGSDDVLLPPRERRESIHRRLSFTDKLIGAPLSNATRNVENKSHVGVDNIEYLNNFLRRQRMKISNVSAGDDSVPVKIILSGPDLSLSSMVTAICHAWLLEHSATHEGWNSVPVINTTRQRMWEHRAVAWLFHHCGLDAQALFFCDEVDLESLVHAQQLSIVVIGQDALQTNDEVASLCTVLVEEQREHAYDLLRLPYIRNLLLAGILQDTQNLDKTAVFFTTRDIIVVDLLLLDANPNHRHSFFGQLNQEHRDSSFEEVLQYNYGECLNNSEIFGGVDEEDRSLPQEIDTYSKGLTTAAKMDLTGVLQLEDEPRFSPATLVDGTVHSHSEGSINQVRQVLHFLVAMTLLFPVFCFQHYLWNHIWWGYFCLPTPLRRSRDISK